jgi:hypothetical protein
MSVLTKAKKLILSALENDDFSSDEVWVKEFEDEIKFHGYENDEEKGKIYIVEGKITRNSMEVYDTTEAHSTEEILWEENTQFTPNTEQYINFLVENLKQQGYECICSRLIL